MGLCLTVSACNVPVSPGWAHANQGLAGSPCWRNPPSPHLSWHSGPLPPSPLSLGHPAASIPVLGSCALHTLLSLQVICINLYLFSGTVVTHYCQRRGFKRLLIALRAQTSSGDRATCTKEGKVVAKCGVCGGAASLRKMVKKMEISQHAKCTCSSCGKAKMKRRAVGIWRWGSCLKTWNAGHLDPQNHFCHHSIARHPKTEELKDQ